MIFKVLKLSIYGFIKIKKKMIFFFYKKLCEPRNSYQFVKT